jgi:hypothetical protein
MRASNQAHGTDRVLTKPTVAQLRVPSGYRREVDGIGHLPGYYIALSAKSLPTFWNNYQPDLHVSRIEKGLDP